MRLFLFWGFVLVHLIACSKNEEAAQHKVTCKDGVLVDAGVFGGKPVRETDLVEKELSVGTLFIFSKADSTNPDTGNPEYYICTASLLDNNIALAAAHCVSDANLKDPKSLKIAFSTDPVCQAKEISKENALRDATKIVRNEKFLGPYGDFTQTDIAMIRFSGKAPEGKRAMKLMFSEIELNALSEIIITGYGKTTDYNDLDEKGAILRYAKVSPLVVSKAPEKITLTNKNPVLYIDQSNGQGGCAGDSGGPTVLKKGDELFVIGVNSAVDSLNTEKFSKQTEVTCHQSLRSASVLAQKDWIMSTYKSLINQDSIGNLSQ